MATNLITLTTKPTAQLSYTFYPPSTSIPSSTPATTPQTLLIFLNGLAAPQTSWTPVIQLLQTTRTNLNLPLPAILTYDRFGQGQTLSRDPLDADAPDPSHGHDILSALADLHQLILQIAQSHLNLTEPNPQTLQIIFTANSIGCALARLYAQTYPGTVSALLLLDHVLANSDFVSIFPDPATFTPSTPLPAGITPQDVAIARGIASKIFHPSVGNKEGLSRRNLASLLPDSDGPRLTAPGGKGPWVTVVGHDMTAFAEESVKMSGGRVSGRVFEEYLTPTWAEYNRGLLGVTDAERGRGPMVAEGSGHVVQLGNPGVVVRELGGLLERVLH
ncbi:alpha/beta fold hydrolase [Aspergillus ibericus CBS 121593]|uniref:AB hydrolase-1 domain-containing protein n=1 Tax=Aspergillus ibericus CBS 121593 TaxID=1448316 RepID=A0A395HET0_9EURO|nr:hypothetical protein BO80DRAFT_460590 [Aspergillus ibericus CBS 121593]RAL06382.1 hypothetical protein BO80DRAFT_460590 [Aspergillus ibericus CBS 121593]